LAPAGTRYPPRVHPAEDATVERKVERSHRVDDQEFYQLLDRDGITDDIHLFNDKLREWEDYYNYHRPHGALAGQTPYERLIAKTKAGVSPRS
jgi:transposase InsO family protein